MPFVSFLASFLATASLAQGHFAFVRVAHNGVWQPPLKYLRNHTSPFLEAPDGNTDGTRDWQYPTYPHDHPNSVRCGRDNLAWANQTSVLTVKAGDTIEFAAHVWQPHMWNDPALTQWDNCPEGRGVCRPTTTGWDSPYHTGPGFFFLSRVPTGQDINAYDGSGDWVKIHTIGYEIRKEHDNLIYWYLAQGGRMIATLPKQTPAGRYLLRADALYPGNGPRAPPQLYPACAHIEVESESTATLPAGIKIPEALSADAIGMQLNGTSFPTGPNGYVYPAGPQWDGEKMVIIKAPTVNDP